MTSWNSPTSLEKATLRAGLSPKLIGLLVAAAVWLLFGLGLWFQNRQALSTGTLSVALFIPVTSALVVAAHLFLSGQFSRAMGELRERTALDPDEFEEAVAVSSPFSLRAELLVLAGSLFLASYGADWGMRFPELRGNGLMLTGLSVASALIAWFVYVNLVRTKHLSTIHRSPLGGAKTLASHWSDPVIRWSLRVAVSFGVLMAASVVLLVDDQLRLIVILCLLASLVYLLNRIWSYLISSVYQSQVLYAFALILVTAAVGTAGYHFLEAWPWLDGLYMTVITMTTVGYGETNVLSQTGRIFTMFLVVMSIGIAGYAISSVAAFVIEGEFQRIVRGRKMDNRISKMRNHIILCGAGRTGSEIARELYKTLTPFVIIEKEQKAVDALSFKNEIPYLIGDASRDSVLRRAGIENASGLLAVLADDQANVFLVLTARALSPKLRIIARLAADHNRQKLVRAGADAVVQTQAIGGLRMASMMIRPSVVTFLDKMLRVTGDTLRVEEIAVSDKMAGQTLGDVDLNGRFGVLVMALHRPSDSGYEFGPKAETELHQEDILIVMGTARQVREIRTL